MSYNEQTQRPLGASGLVGAGIPTGYETKLGAQAQLNRPLAPDEAPNIECLLNQHLGTIGYLKDRLELLYTRLGPFMIQAPELASGNSALTARSGMGNVISSATAQVQTAANMVQEMLDRLDN